MGRFLRVLLLFFSIFFKTLLTSTEIELPLAPYNVKLMCRQGRRFSKDAQTPRQCPSSSTSCGFFEFSIADAKHGTPKTGVYDCVDTGILRDIQDDDYEQEDDSKKSSDSPTPFSEMCGAVPKCQVFPIDHLRKAFVKYLVQQYDIKLEGLSVTEIRFCCAMFHSTVQKLVTSPTYQLPQVDAPPVNCQGVTCDAGAVGCLLHAVHDGDDYADDDEGEEEDYEDQRRFKRHGLALNDYIEDDDYVNAVELSFDDLDIELITREPPVETTTLPSLRLPMKLEDLTTTKPMTTTTTTTTTPVPKTIQKIVSSKKYDSYEDEVEPLQSTHCVYRHLNNEYYRYCLLVHQSRDGDRCYHHKSQTICCCFVGPDKETCDPTEMDLIVPPPVTLSPATTTRVLITTSSSTSTTTTTTTTTTSTTTTEAPTTEMVKTTHPPLPPQVYRPRPIDQTKRKQNRRKCRVTYVRTKSGQRTRPVLVCDSVSRASSSLIFLLFFYWSLY